MIVVLVVEDYPATQTCVRQAILDLFDYEAHVVVTDGVDFALEMMRSIQFDLIVSDLRLGEASGAQILDHLRVAHPRLVDRFVFFTGSAEEARVLHNKVIDKEHAAEFADRLSALLPAEMKIGPRRPRAVAEEILEEEEP